MDSTIWALGSCATEQTISSWEHSNGRDHGKRDRKVRRKRHLKKVWSCDLHRMCPSAARGSRFECLDSRLTQNLQQLASPFLLRAYKTSKSRWAIRGPEGVSRFAGRTQAAVDALETTRKAAIPLVSLSGPHAETARRLWKLVNLAGNGYFRVA